MKVFEKKQMENNREYAYRLLRDNIMTFRLVRASLSMRMNFRS